MCRRLSQTMIAEGRGMKSDWCIGGAEELTAGLTPVRCMVALNTASIMSSGRVSFRPPLLPCSMYEH